VVVSIRRLLIPGLVALGVAIVDEIHQTYLPYRDGSIIDVFLDTVGISLTLLLMLRILKTNATHSKDPINPTNSSNSTTRS
jgi:VanZ family protein